MIDIIVVGYRSESFLQRLLDDIRTLTENKHTVYYADNTGNAYTLPARWNMLAALGKSEFLAILNPDIALCPQWDHRLLSGLMSDHSIGIVTADPVMVSCPAPSKEQMAEIANTRTAMGLTGDSICFFCSVMRRNLWSQLKGVDERMRFYMQDIDFIVRANERCGKGTKRVLSCPVWHSGSASTKEAKARGELDPDLECKFGSAVFDGVRHKRMKEWHLLTDEERNAVRRDPLYAKMGR
jgi:hypothetical protein